MLAKFVKGAAPGALTFGVYSMRRIACSPVNNRKKNRPAGARRGNPRTHQRVDYGPWWIRFRAH
jgi:hypothetical protein